jgi:hypothetical protein
MKGETDEVLIPDYLMRKYQFISNGEPYFRPYFLYARAFNDTLVSRNNGVLLISLEQSFLSDLLGGQSVGDGAIAALLDASGGIIFASGKADDLSFEEALRSARNLETGDTLSAGGRSRFLIRSKRGAGLEFDRADSGKRDVPRAQQDAVAHRRGGVVALALGLVMILIVSGMVTRPFRALAQSMARAGEGDLRLSKVNSPSGRSTSWPPNTTPCWSASTSLIGRIRTIEQEKRMSELAALRSQINPHFTYNTLDSIRWVAMMQNAPKVAEMISRLVKLLKLTTGRGGSSSGFRTSLNSSPVMRTSSASATTAGSKWSSPFRRRWKGRVRSDCSCSPSWRTALSTALTTSTPRGHPGSAHREGRRWCSSSGTTGRAWRFPRASCRLGQAGRRAPARGHRHFQRQRPHQGLVWGGIRRCVHFVAVRGHRRHADPAADRVLRE